MLGKIHLDETSPEPLYRQLRDQIAALIRSGNLANSSRLPATRELASQFGLNRTTVSAAYELLEADGLIRGHVGRGSFVHFEGPISMPAFEDPVISFESSRPSGDQFPLSDFQKTCTEVVTSTEAGSILQLGSPAGYFPLRRLLISEAAEEGALDDGDDLIITNGCQHALDLIQRHFTAPGSTVLVEDPVYHGLRNVFDRSAVRLVGLPVTPEGVRPEDLERAIISERPQLVVLTPNFQNPTGLTIPRASREAIARIIERYGCVLVENDIYGDLRYRGDALPTIRSLQTVSRGILIRSFSKTVFPGLRVGWMIGPTAVTSALAEIRQWCDLHTDHLSQAILLRFKESGRLKTHLARVQEAGRQKLDAVLEACDEHLPAGSTFTRPQGGMNLWVTLPREIDAADLLSRARREAVTYIPGRMFSVGKVNPATLRLSFGGLPPERIRAGIAILGRLFRDEIQRSEPVNRFDAAPALV